MSIDIDWPRLKTELEGHLTTHLTSLLSSSALPSFLTAPELHSFSIPVCPAPTLALVDVRDVYAQFEHPDLADEVQRAFQSHRDFLPDPTSPMERSQLNTASHSRNSSYSTNLAQSNHPFHSNIASHSHTNPPYSHMNHSFPQTNLQYSQQNRHFAESVGLRTPRYPFSPPGTPAEPFLSPSRSSPNQNFNSDTHSETSKNCDGSNSTTKWPTIQLHFDLSYACPLSLVLSSSLVIDIPSPAFMALPLKIHVTEIVVQCQVIVAVHGEKKVVHLSLVPLGSEFASHHVNTNEDNNNADSNNLNTTNQKNSNHSNSNPSDINNSNGPNSNTVQNSIRNNNAHNLVDIGNPGTSSERKNNSATTINNSEDTAIHNTSFTHTNSSTSNNIIKSITIQSDVGDMSKHALHNVPVVEKFITSLLHSTLQSELVFPNFYSIKM